MKIAIGKNSHQAEIHPPPIETAAITRPSRPMAKRALLNWRKRRSFEANTEAKRSRRVRYSVAGEWGAADSVRVAKGEVVSHRFYDSIGFTTPDFGTNGVHGFSAVFGPMASPRVPRRMYHESPTKQSLTKTPHAPAPSPYFGFSALAV